MAQTVPRVWLVQSTTPHASPTQVQGGVLGPPVVPPVPVVVPEVAELPVVVPEVVVPEMPDVPPLLVPAVDTPPELVPPLVLPPPSTRQIAAQTPAQQICPLQSLSDWQGTLPILRVLHGPSPPAISSSEIGAAPLSSELGRMIPTSGELSAGFSRASHGNLTIN
jgi:hypothetical protein